MVLGLGLSGLVRAADSLRLGVVNEQPEKPDHALGQYERLHLYFHERLAPRGIETEDLVFARPENEMASLVDKGEVDALIEGVVPTLSIQRRTEKLAPALLVWRKGQRQYHSVFSSAKIA